MPKTARATRPLFEVKDISQSGCIFSQGEVQFDWYQGMSLAMHQKSSLAMEQAIVELLPYTEGKILEVSTKSVNLALGVELSGMVLRYTDSDSGESYSVLNWFQSTKQYTKDGKVYGPYPELRSLEPKEAKRFLDPRIDKKIAARYAENELFVRIREEISGAVISSFMFKGEHYKTDPKSAFYDYLYAQALHQHKEMARAVLDYLVFTDIEFSPKVGKRVVRYNTQARACAIYVALARRKKLDKALKDFDSFIESVQYEEAT